MHWQTAQKPYCLHPAWRGSVKSWQSVCVASLHQCGFVHVWEKGERESVLAAGCFVVAQRPIGQQMSSCSRAWSASPLSILSNWLIYPQSKLLVPSPRNELITVLMIPYILFSTFVLCFRAAFVLLGNFKWEQCYSADTPWSQAISRSIIYPEGLCKLWKGYVIYLQWGVSM